MAIGGVEQANYRSSMAVNKSTQNVNGTERFALEKASGAQELSEAEEMELFKKEFYEDLSEITNHKTVRNAAVNISETAFKAMKDDPDYREKVLSLIQRDFGDSYAPRNCSVLITVGATLNEYRGDSWPVGYDSEFDIRSQNSFYKKTSEKKDRLKELLEKYLEKRAQTKEYQQEVLNTRSAEKELERSRSLQLWNHKKAFEAYEANAVIEDRLRHTVVQSVTAFNDTRAEILRAVREEKGEYDRSDIVNACGLSYAKLYSEIEQRYENKKERYYKADGTLLTKEEEIEWLDMQFEQEVKWQKACARVAAEGQVFMGHIPEVPMEEIEELGYDLYRAKDTYRKLHSIQKSSVL